jgi:hypothetical protein
MRAYEKSRSSSGVVDVGPPASAPRDWGAWRYTLCRPPHPQLSPPTTLHTFLPIKVIQAWTIHSRHYGLQPDAEHAAEGAHPSVVVATDNLGQESGTADIVKRWERNVAWGKKNASFRQQTTRTIDHGTGSTAGAQGAACEGTRLRVAASSFARPAPPAPVVVWTSDDDGVDGR